jgi:hypothetical protein
MVSFPLGYFAFLHPAGLSFFNSQLSNFNLITFLRKSKQKESLIPRSYLRWTTIHVEPRRMPDTMTIPMRKDKILS